MGQAARNASSQASQSASSRAALEALKAHRQASRRLRQLASPYVGPNPAAGAGAAKPSAKPARVSWLARVAASLHSGGGWPAYRLDRDPLGPVNPFVRDDGSVAHSQKSFVDKGGRLSPPGASLDVVKQVRGKPADKRNSGFTSASEAVQARYAPKGRSTFLLTALANAHNSLQQSQIQRVIDHSADPELDTQEGAAAKADVGVPASSKLTQRQKLKAWSDRDREILLKPSAQIAQLHRLVPRKTDKPSAETLARLKLPADASWIDVDEARAKRQKKPFDRNAALETHRKITITPKTLEKVQRALARKRYRELRKQMSDLHLFQTSGKMSAQEAQKNREAILKEQEIAAKRLAKSYH
jgi:hypothetical protein